MFRDEHGTLCAMGFLIASTGRTDIVDDVARRRNLARIHELASDARLVAWLDSAGLTVAEAARIQPNYPGQYPPCCNDSEPNDYRRAYYVAFSAGITAATATLAVANLDASGRSARRSKVYGWLGMIAGASQVAYGLSVMKAGDPRLNIGYANLAIGGAAAGVSAWRVIHGAPAPQQTVSLAPYVSRDGAAGLALTVAR